MVRKAESAIEDAQVAGQADDLKKLKKRIDLYFQTDKLEDYARLKLKTIKQADGQSAADLKVEITDLYTDAGWSDVSNLDDQIKATLLSALKNDNVRLQWKFSNMAGKTPLTIGGIISVANAYQEAKAEQQISHHTVQAVRQGKRQAFKKYQENKFSQPPKPQCSGCGSRQHAYRSDLCPAKDATCHQCQKLHHYKTMCRSKSSTTKPQFSQKKNFGKKKFYPKKRYYQTNKVDVQTQEASHSVNTSANTSAGASGHASADLADLLDRQVFMPS